jgi:hypothetical protein
MIKELPHAQGLGPLYSHQALLAPNVIGIADLRKQCLVAIRVPFQPLNPFCNQSAKSRADLELLARALRTTV